MYKLPPVQMKAREYLLVQDFLQAQRKVPAFDNPEMAPEDRWPYNIVTQAPTTEEKIMEALRNGPYGRCVYRCDNNVVDHQLTTMTFENGVKASLTMTAYTAYGGRRYVFYGTHGDMILDEESDTLSVRNFIDGTVTYPISELISDEKGYGHGGGDAKLIEQLYDVLAGNATGKTSFDASVESHLIGICAEESRVKGGELIYVHKD